MQTWAPENPFYQPTESPFNPLLALLTNDAFIKVTFMGALRAKNLS